MADNDFEDKDASNIVGSYTLYKEPFVDILAALAAWLKENNYEKADDFVKEAENLVERVRVCADLSKNYTMLIPLVINDRVKTLLLRMLLQ